MFYESVFQAEVNAIGVCYRMEMETGQTNTNIAQIFRLPSKTLWLKGTLRLVWERQMLMIQLVTHGRVKLVWTPGHVLIKGNEMFW